MKKAVLCLFNCLLISYSATARTPNWQVKPTICINVQAEQACSLVLQITQMDLPLGRYCLQLNEQTLDCYRNTEFPLKIAVQLDKNTELILVDQQQNIVFTTTLFIKSQQANKQRRRLRNPWSIF